MSQPTARSQEKLARIRPMLRPNFGYLETWGGFRTLLCLVIGVAHLAPSTASSEALDRWQLSALIETTKREIYPLARGKHIHIVDPADYLKRKAAGDAPTIDLSDIVRRINGELRNPLGLVGSMRLTENAGYVLSADEMAAALYARPKGGTLCVVIPRSAPLGVSDIASPLSGADEDNSRYAKSLNAEDLFRFLLYHEIAHCSENPLQYRSGQYSAYDVFLAECRADAFAVLMHVRKTGDLRLPRYVARLRRLGAKNRHDFEHQTAEIIERTLKFATELRDTRLFKGRTANDLLHAAEAIVSKHVMDRTTFNALLVSTPKSDYSTPTN